MTQSNIPRLRVDLDRDAVHKCIIDKGWMSCISNRQHIELYQNWCETNGFDYKIYKMGHFSNILNLKYKIDL
jgi:hypothetical protein